MPLHSVRGIAAKSSSYTCIRCQSRAVAMAGNAVPMEKVAGGQPAQTIAGFCELMPGVPWTTQLVDDIFYELQTAQECSQGKSVKQFNFRLPAMPRLSEVYHVEGWMKVMNPRGAEALVVWLAVIKTDRWVQNPIAAMNGHGRLDVKKQSFPNTREGLKHAIQHLQEAAQWLSRRGICVDCPGREEFRALKRIRLADHEVCGSCLVARAVAPHTRNTK